MISSFYKWTVRQSILKIITLFYLTDLSISILFSLFYSSSNSIEYKFSNKFEEFFLVVLIAPVIETYLFQHLIIKFLEKKISSTIYILLICSLVFGLMHTYNIVYFFKACISGFLYSLLYLIIKQYKNKNPILYVVICHSIYNLTGFLINIFI